MIRASAILAALAVCAACGGGGGGTPTTPAPAPTFIGPVGVTVQTISLRDRTVTLSWIAAPNASSYVVEVAQSATFANASSTTTPDANPSLRLTNLPLGVSYARVRSKNDSGISDPSITVNFTLFDFQDFVEALFLGTGPLRPPNDPVPCMGTGVFSAFRRGSHVRVRVSTSVPASSQQAMRDFVELIPSVTLGQLMTTFELTPETDPAGADQQVTIAFAPDTSSICGNQKDNMWFCGAPGAELDPGGAVRTAKWTYSSQIVPLVAVHEIVHTIGMCHVNTPFGSSFMGSQTEQARLTAFDIEALNAVYGSGVPTGASRSAFVAAGLVKP